MQGASERVVDSGGAVFFAQINDEMPQRLFRSWLEVDDGGFGPSEAGSGGEVDDGGVQAAMSEGVSHLAECGPLLDAAGMEFPHEIDQLHPVTIAAEQGLDATGSADGVAPGRWLGGEQRGEEQEWEGSGHGGK